MTIYLESIHRSVQEFLKKGGFLVIVGVLLFGGSMVYKYTHSTVNENDTLMGTDKNVSIESDGVSRVFLSDLAQGQSVAEKKDALLTRLMGVSRSPLNAIEKTAIMNELGGEKAAAFDLTSEQREMILRALNTK
jgi:hypothetical protein